jgi:hypothetical protein
MSGILKAFFCELADDPFSIFVPGKCLPLTTNNDEDSGQVTDLPLGPLIYLVSHLNVCPVKIGFSVWYH